MGKKLDNAISLYMDGIRDGNVRHAVETYTGDRYTQHSTGVADGVEGFVEFFEPFVERNPVRDIQVFRSIEDGRYVFVHVYQDINDGEARWVTTDFFDTDADDKIVEHWDVIAAYVEETPSGHSSIDGPTNIVDLDRTDENKATVRAMIEQTLMVGGDATRTGEFIHDACIQHSPGVDGRPPVFAGAAAQSDKRLVYDEIVLLVGQGNFVATLCRARSNGEELAQVDVFRLEDGRIVEHWDNSEPVPANDVNGGKF